MYAMRLRRAAAVGTLAILAAATVQLMNPTMASARCVGANNYTTTDLYDPDTGARVAWETPVDLTCNDNGDYQTTLGAASGWTTRLYSQNGGVWTYRKADSDGHVTWGAASHQSGEVLCATHNASGNSWCGTGTDVIYEPTISEYMYFDVDFGVLNSGF